jgi:hypothetical protein
MPIQVKLGHFVREVTTGIEGTVTSCTEQLTGNVQFLVQPISKDGVYVEGMAFDMAQVEHLHAGLSAKVIEPPVETGIRLGDEVQDVVTNLVGTVIMKATFMNGCIYYEIHGKAAKDSSVKVQFVEYQRLKVTGPGITGDLAKQATPDKVVRGGPATRMMKRG